ncbi:MAG: hypothetical protein NVS4B6_13220 [Mycobacterium sp.]
MHNRCDGQAASHVGEQAEQAAAEESGGTETDSDEAFDEVSADAK